MVTSPLQRWHPWLTERLEQGTPTWWERRPSWPWAACLTLMPSILMRSREPWCSAKSRYCGRGYSSECCCSLFFSSLPSVPICHCFSSGQCNAGEGMHCSRGSSQGWRCLPWGSLWGGSPVVLAVWAVSGRGLRPAARDLWALRGQRGFRQEAPRDQLCGPRHWSQHGVSGDGSRHSLSHCSSCRTCHLCRLHHLPVPRHARAGHGSSPQPRPPPLHHHPGSSPHRLHPTVPGTSSAARPPTHSLPCVWSCISTG